MKNGIFIIGLLAAFMLSSAQRVAAQFEGFIEFTSTKQGQALTTYKYFVKGQNVRVEELDKDGKVTGIMLVNTQDGTMLALNPMRKVYMEVKNKLPKKLEVTSTEGKTKKELVGYKCSQWTVVNSETKVKCNYWVAKDGFDFFIPLMQTINRKENIAMHYMALDEVEGGFPMIGEELDSNGNIVAKLEVKKVTKATIGDDLFALPTGYTKFEK